MRQNDVTILALEHKEHPKWTLEYSDTSANEDNSFRNHIR